MQYLRYYLLTINALAFLLMRADKKKARQHLWRIPEAVLFAAALSGGALGGTLGMLFFSHKTKKSLFSVGFPALLFLQFGVLALWLT